MRNIFVAFLLLVALSPFNYAAAAESTMLNGIQVLIWKPTVVSKNKAPLIIFSHGLKGCAGQSEFLMKKFAAAGYFVAAPEHMDSLCITKKQKNARVKLYPNVNYPDVAQPELWSENSYSDRRVDVERVLDGLLADKNVSKIIDKKRIGIAGHSLGGYTGLGDTGAWPEWKDKRFKAMLALSPYLLPYLDKTIKEVDVPIMYQGGTADLGITPFVSKSNGAYDQTKSEKYYVEFKGAGHMAWTSVSATYHDQISQYSLAFFNKVFKVEGADTSVLKTKLSQVSEIRYND